jgi:voltage-gated potassium channel
MKNLLPPTLRNNLLIAGFGLLCVITVGTCGYYFLGLFSTASPHWGLSDCFYMTIITLTTVGFGEVIDVGSVPGARLFTIAYLLSGLGVSAYFLSTLTAFIVEGELKNIFWRKKMETLINKLEGHIILCGVGRVGRYILGELVQSGRDFAIIEQSEELILELQEEFGQFPAVSGDSTHNEELLAAGVKRAKGVISALGDDKDNLCVVVTCRQLNPAIHVISRCNLREFAGKLELMGAEVVMPNYIGGLRIASQMIRPSVVSYLDTMLRDKNSVVRIEEIYITASSDLIDRSISSVNFSRYGNLLLLAVQKLGNPSPIYNPDKGYVIEKNDTLIFQATMEAMSKFRNQHA